VVGEDEPLVIKDAVPDVKSVSAIREHLTLQFDVNVSIDPYPRTLFFDSWIKYLEAITDQYKRLEREMVLKTRASRMVSRT
jgi:hypothetical protein